MKNIILLFFILIFNNAAGQNKDDFKSVIELTIAEFKNDSIYLNEQFDNKFLLLKFKESDSKNVELRNIIFDKKLTKRRLRKLRNKEISNFTNE